MNLQYEQAKNEIKGVELDPDTVKKAFEKVENVVFEGGGIRGIAFGGSLKCLEDFNLSSQIKRIAGSSAGAIVATAIAVGYSADEITEILSKTDFKRFKDDSWGILRDAIRLFTQFGIYKGNAFQTWMENLIKAKTGNPHITFLELYKQTQKTLVITGTCLNRGITYYFHHLDKRFSNMPIALATRISMSVPLYWRALKIDNLIGDVDLMVDGGVLNNYPIYVFDGDRIGTLPSELTQEQIANSHTIGFKLMSSDERPDTYYNVKIRKPKHYLKALLNALLLQCERGHIRSGYWERTICINTHDISFLDFNLTKQRQQLLLEEGYIATKHYLQCLVDNKKNKLNRLIC